MGVSGSHLGATGILLGARFVNCEKTNFDNSIITPTLRHRMMSKNDDFEEM